MSKIPTLKSVVGAVPLTNERRFLASHTLSPSFPLPSKILSIDMPAPTTSVNSALKLVGNNTLQWPHRLIGGISHHHFSHPTASLDSLSVLSLLLWKTCVAPSLIGFSHITPTASLGSSIRNAPQGSQAESHVATSHSRPHRLSLAESTIAMLTSDYLSRRSVGSQSPTMVDLRRPQFGCLSGEINHRHFSFTATQALSGGINHHHALIRLPTSTVYRASHNADALRLIFRLPHSTVCRVSSFGNGYHYSIKGSMSRFLQPLDRYAASLHTLVTLSSKTTSCSRNGFDRSIKGSISRSCNPQNAASPSLHTSSPGHPPFCCSHQAYRYTHYGPNGFFHLQRAICNGSLASMPCNDSFPSGASSPSAPPGQLWLPLNSALDNPVAAAALLRSGLSMPIMILGSDTTDVGRDVGMANNYRRSETTDAMRARNSFYSLKFLSFYAFRNSTLRRSVSTKLVADSRRLPPLVKGNNTLQWPHRLTSGISHRHFSHPTASLGDLSVLSLLLCQTCVAPSLIGSSHITSTASLGSSVKNAPQGSQAESHVATSHSRPHRLSLAESAIAMLTSDCLSRQPVGSQSPTMADLRQSSDCFTRRSVKSQASGMATTIQSKALCPGLSTLSCGASPHHTPVTLSPPSTPNSGNGFNSLVMWLYIKVLTTLRSLCRFPSYSGHPVIQNDFMLGEWLRPLNQRLYIKVMQPSKCDFTFPSHFFTQSPPILLLTSSLPLHTVRRALGSHISLKTPGN
eukprot:Gb_27660 [translate_table: standard]